jgi:pyruvate-ferredoxin/flavodoxin oxidoreductase
MVPFHEFLEMSAADREGKAPFIYSLQDRKLRRLSVSREMVTLAEERLLFWSQLRQLAGVEIPEATRERVTAALESEYDERAAAMRAEYERSLADLQANYAHVVARRLAEGLMRVAEGRTVDELMTTALAAPYVPLPAPAAPVSAPISPAAPEGAAAAAVPSAPAAAPSPSARVELVDVADAMVMEPYIETALCTSCNECTNLNKKLFAYDANKQAYVKDPRGGTFQQLVKAAELCPVKIIHPGTPLNPKEKDLDKWVARAAAFN